MANYSTYIIRIVKDEAFELSFLNDLTQEIANATVELEPPLIYHVGLDGFAVDIRYTCRRSRYDFKSFITDNNVLFAQIDCDSGGTKDSVTFWEKVKGKNVLSYSGSEAGYEFDKIIISGQSSNSNYLDELNEMLVETDSILRENILEVKSVGYYACSSYHEIRGDYNIPKTKRVSHEEFLKLYHSQPLDKIYFSNHSLENLYLSCFKGDKFPEFLIPEIFKIKFIFNNRIVHEIRETTAYPRNFNSNYWDNIMIKEELRRKVLYKVM